MLHTSLLPCPDEVPYPGLVAQLPPSVSRHGPEILCAVAGETTVASPAHIHSLRISLVTPGIASLLRFAPRSSCLLEWTGCSSTEHEPFGHKAGIWHA